MSVLRPARAKNSTRFIVRDVHAQEEEISLDLPQVESFLEHEQQGTGTDNEITYPDGGLKAWTVVAGCFFGIFADFGLLNSISAIEAYVASHQLESFSTLSISWIFSVYVGVCYMLTILSGVVFDEVGFKIPMILGTILVSFGVFITGSCSQPYQFILSFGIMTGAGNAFCMSPLIGLISHWFDKKRGFAIGIVTMGGSIGGIVFPLVLNALYSKVGFTWGMRILGFILAATLAFSTFLLRERPELRKALRQNSDTDGAETATYKYLIKNMFDPTSFKDKKFLMCALACTLLEVGLVCSLTFYSSYAINVAHSSQSVAFNMVAIVNATSVLGRIAPNYLSDKIGVFNVFIYMTICCVIAQFVVWLKFGSNISALYAFSVLYGFFSASVLSLIPVACSAVSPVKHFGKRYATMYVGIGIGCLIAIPISGYIIGEGSKANYNNFIIYVSVFTSVGLVALFITRRMISGRYAVFIKV